jgi:hypothetical protein
MRGSFFSSKALRDSRLMQKRKRGVEQRAVPMMLCLRRGRQSDWR